MKLNYNQFFFHFTEMRILTHTKSFLRFKLKLVTLVTCGSIEIVSPNFVIFVTFYITQHYPPSVCPFTTNSPPPNVTGGCGFRWGGGGMWAQVGGGVWVQVGGDQVERGGRGLWLFRWGGGGGGESFCNLSLAFEMV